VKRRDELGSNIMYFKTLDDPDANFFGRVSESSIKNIQISDDYDDSKIYLQFGRAGKNQFNLDVGHPFSIYQAFALCLTTFES